VVADSAQHIIDAVGTALVLQRRRRQQQRQLHRSSRSHVVLSLRIERGKDASSNGMIHLVDLAVSRVWVFVTSVCGVGVGEWEYARCS
jgi:hypothetical protein